MSWVAAFLLGNPIGRAFLGAVAASVLMVGAYGAGYWRASSKYDMRDRLRELEADNAALVQDLGAQRLAAEINRKNAADNQRSAVEAQKLAEEYERELAKRPDAACLLTGADIEQLQRSGHGAR